MPRGRTSLALDRSSSVRDLSPTTRRGCVLNDDDDDDDDDDMMMMMMLWNEVYGMVMCVKALFVVPVVIMVCWHVL